MPAPLPILCESCGYDITPFADAAHTNHSLPCPECVEPLHNSLPERRQGLLWQHRLTLDHALRTYLDIYSHPLTFWRRLRLYRPHKSLWLCNVLAAALVSTLTLFIFLCIYTSAPNAFAVAPVVLLVLLPSLLLLTVLFAAITLLVATALKWRSTRASLWTAIDHATAFWPLGTTLAVILLGLVEPVTRPTGYLPDLVAILVFTAFLAPPILTLFMMIFGLHALRFANTPRTPY